MLLLPRDFRSFANIEGKGSQIVTKFHRMFIRAVLFLIISSACCHVHIRHVTSTLKVHDGGRWGRWYPPQYCPYGQYATGYKLKIEDRLETGDDTSLNGIRLDCGKETQTSTRNTATSNVGRWGLWHGWFIHCDRKEFLTSFNLHVMSSFGRTGDDTAANYVKFRCRHKSGGNEVELREFPGQQPPSSAFLGDYVGWSFSCKEGSAICGIETRVQGPRRSRDNTALNDVKFHCCDY